MTSSTDASRGASSSPLGTSNGTFASASVRLARTIRCAIVASETRNARAISGVVRPPSSRSVSAIRASVESTGWQQVNTSRSRSSATSSASSAGASVRERDLELAHQLLLLALERAAAPQHVDRAVLRGGHEPGARVVRDARLRPALERGDQRVLREVLGEADVAHDPRQPRDQPRRLDPPDRVDRALGRRCGHVSSARRGLLGRLLRELGDLLDVLGEVRHLTTCRTSMIESSSSGQRIAHSTASSLDFTSITQ